MSGSIIYLSSKKRRVSLIFLAAKMVSPASRSWNNSPSPGHRPRLEPRRLRDSRKLNWSTVVVVVSTSLRKASTRLEKLLSKLDLEASVTVAVVTVQGTLQSDARAPTARESVEYNIYLTVRTIEIRKKV